MARVAGSQVDRLAQAAYAARRPFAGALDIEATAAAAGVSVFYREMHSTTLGLTLDECSVYLNAALPEGLARFVFAHELAHVLIRQRHLSWAPRGRGEEAFADEFAFELVAPAADIEGQPPTLVARKFRIPAAVAHERVARLRGVWAT